MPREERLKEGIHLEASNVPVAPKALVRLTEAMFQNPEETALYRNAPETQEITR